MATPSPPQLQPPCGCADGEHEVRRRVRARAERQAGRQAQAGRGRQARRAGPGGRAGGACATRRTRRRTRRMASSWEAHSLREAGGVGAAASRGGAGEAGAERSVPRQRRVVHGVNRPGDSTRVPALPSPAACVAGRTVTRANNLHPLRTEGLTTPALAHCTQRSTSSSSRRTRCASPSCTGSSRSWAGSSWRSWACWPRCAPSSCSEGAAGVQAAAGRRRGGTRRRVGSLAPLLLTARLDCWPGRVVASPLY